MDITLQSNGFYTEVSQTNLGRVMCQCRKTDWCRYVNDVPVPILLRIEFKGNLNKQHCRGSERVHSNASEWYVCWRRLMCRCMCTGCAAGSGLSLPVYRCHSPMIAACIANRLDCSTNWGLSFPSGLARMLEIPCLCSWVPFASWHLYRVCICILLDFKIF